MASKDVTTTSKPGATLVPMTEVAERFPALDPDSEMRELIEENLSDGETLGLGALTRVGNPSGKSITFSIPNVETGKADYEDKIQGIIIAYQEGRAYFKSNVASDNTPPDCASRDGKIGIGEFGQGSETNPTGACETCPMSQWERKAGPKGEDVPPPCKQHSKLLMVTENEALPLFVRVPRTSLKPFREYRQNLLKKMAGLPGVLTEIGLREEKSADGTTYGQFTFRMVEKFEKPAKKAALEFGNEMKARVFNAAPIGALETSGGEGVIEGSVADPDTEGGTTIDFEGLGDPGGFDEYADAEISDEDESAPVS